jgi:hypothetical protein
MIWQQVRESYPSQWVVLEAVEAHNIENKRIFENISVVEAMTDSLVAMKQYQALHKKHPQREFLFASTVNDKLDVTVHEWVGIRSK